MADDKSTDASSELPMPEKQLDFIPKGFGALSTEWELAELELEIMLVADKLDPRALKAMQLWMSGQTKAECMVMAGYNVQDFARAAASFAALARRPEAKEYADLCRRVIVLRSLKENGFTESEWLGEVRSS